MHVQMCHVLSRGMSKCFHWNLDQRCKIYLKNSNLLWRYKQNTDRISTKWNTPPSSPPRPFLPPHLNLRVAEKDQSFENERSSRLIEYHYGNEIFLLQTNLYIKKTSLQPSKNLLQTKHTSQMSSLQKLLKVLQIVIAKNLKTFSINAYKKISFHI